MSVCHLRYIATPLRRTVWALIFIVCLFSAPRPLFADTPPLLLEVSSALTSFYGSKFEGKKTANGQRYNSEALTAAHRSLPFGTVVRITNHANGRDAMVRINDRGPGSKRLLLDISRAAARELNMIRAGIAKVHMEVVGDAQGRPLIPGTEFYLDMGTASSEARGKAEVERLRGQLRLPAGKSIRLVSEAMPGKKMRYFVGVGPFSTFTKAEKAFMELKKTWPRTRVVCAKTRDVPATATLALAVPADDLPDSVAEYKGKASENKSTKSTKAKASKASKSKKSSKKSSATASGRLAERDKAKVSASSSRKNSAVKASGSSKSKVAAKPSPQKDKKVASGSSSAKKDGVSRSTTRRSAEKTTGSKVASGKKGSQKVASKRTSSKKVAAKKASQPAQVAAEKRKYTSVAER